MKVQNIVTIFAIIWLLMGLISGINNDNTNALIYIVISNIYVAASIILGKLRKQNER